MYNNNNNNHSRSTKTLPTLTATCQVPWVSFSTSLQWVRCLLLLSQLLQCSPGHPGWGEECCRTKSQDQCQDMKRRILNNNNILFIIIRTPTSDPSHLFIRCCTATVHLRVWIIFLRIILKIITKHLIIILKIITRHLIIIIKIITRHLTIILKIITRHIIINPLNPGTTIPGEQRLVCRQITAPLTPATMTDSSWRRTWRSWWRSREWG